MRFLVDNAVSPLVARDLAAAGHDAVHVRERGLQRAPDEQLFELAALEERVIVSADTDFGTLLALRQATRPSVIFFRHAAPRKPEAQGRILCAHLDEWLLALSEGCLITIEGARVRVRRLPILRRS